MKPGIVRRAAGADCASIIADLPGSFGRPEVNAEYVNLAERKKAWVAEIAGEAIGLMMLSDPGFSAIDIHFLAVRRHHQGKGVGKALIARAIIEARLLHRSFLTVKTLGPSQVSEPYERARAFYLAAGFQPLEELTGIWGPDTPCLLMAMAVAP